MMAGLALAVEAQDAPPVGVGDPPTFLLEYYDAWVGSPHADVTAEAFVHWDADGEVSERCATCHTTPGYRDFLGADGSEAGVVDAPAPLGTVVNCDSCHNPVAAQLTSVTMPSGAVDSYLDDSGRCMVCHPGRASTVAVNSAIEEVGLTDSQNEVSAELGFINVHYYAAAASLFGSEAQGGYQYDGQRYEGRFSHVEAYDTCAECHSSHTTEVQVGDCATCHEGVESVEDLRDIRMPGSMMDYDGDGDDLEGIAGEIETLQEMLLEAIQLYGVEVAGTAIAYDTHSHPYWFNDTNENGDSDEDEVNGDNAYASYTPRLLEAAYNYQFSLKDPGGFAHNAKYHIQLLFDSIAMLNAELEEGVDLTWSVRNDAGHFDATAEAFRHWDEDGEVPATCTKCHTADGLPFLLENNVTIASEPSNGLNCTTCHDNMGEFTTYVVDSVVFPSGAEISFGEGDENNLCLNCHQGRESTVSVDRAITSAGVGDDEVSAHLRIRKPHYFAAGATLFGSEAQGAYQFAGQEYVGRNLHAEDVVACSDCHDQHSLVVQAEVCEDCHEDVRDVEDIPFIRQEAEDAEPIDYDGDGDDEEPIADEIASLHEALLVAIQTYAADTLGTAIAYDSAAYPYWFTDTNGNGAVDPDEANSDNGFANWSPNLLRAAYNYQYVAKDPGAFAHNADYTLQVLYDSLAAMGGEDAVSTLTRPPV